MTSSFDTVIFHLIFKALGLSLVLKIFELQLTASRNSAFLIFSLAFAAFERFPYRRIHVVHGHIKVLVAPHNLHLSLLESIYASAMHFTRM